MSYGIELVRENGECCVLSEGHQEGGNIVVGYKKDGVFVSGGDTRTKMNVTYNYSPYFYKYLDEKEGIRWLYEKKGKDCIKRLEKAIEPHKDAKQSSDYWANTEGNCVHALKVLLSWAKLFPEGTFHGD